MILGVTMAKIIISHLLLFQITDGANSRTSDGKKGQKSVSFSGCDQGPDEEIAGLDDRSESDSDYLVDWLTSLTKVEEGTIENKPKRPTKPRKGRCFHQ